MKCPICNVEIPAEETVELSFTTGDENFIEARLAGQCPVCHKPYIWTALYRYEKSYDLEDDE